MARGKHAALAATRRAEAAHEVIDRLTGELADAKLRARRAEERATRLEGIEVALREHNSDAIVEDLRDAIHRWKQVAEDDQRRRRAAIREVQTALAADIRLLMGELQPGSADVQQFIARRYPAIVNALSAHDGMAAFLADADRTDRLRHNNTATARRFSPERLQDYQRSRGVRVAAAWAPDRDFADVMADLLDVQQIGLDPTDWAEALGATDG